MCANVYQETATVAGLASSLPIDMIERRTFVEVIDPNGPSAIKAANLCRVSRSAGNSPREAVMISPNLLSDLLYDRLHEDESDPEQDNEKFHRPGPPGSWFFYLDHDDHDDDDNEGFNGNDDEIPNIVEGPLWKTRMCRFARQGVCMRMCMGSTCRYAHSFDELRNVPDFTQTEICPITRDGGQCINPECSFAHNESELRAFPDELRTKPCRFVYSSHGCRSGNNCRFSHTMRPMTSNKAKKRKARKQQNRAAFQTHGRLPTPNSIGASSSTQRYPIYEL